MDLKKLLDKLTVIGGSRVLNESSKPDFLDIDKDGNKKEPMKKAALDKKKRVGEMKISEAVTDQVTFTGTDQMGNPKHVHFGKNNGRPYHVIAGKPGTNFAASAVIPSGAKGTAGSEEIMQQIANLVHSGKHKEALAQLNKHSNITFTKSLAEGKALKKEVVEFDESEFNTWEQYAKKEGYEIREAGNLPGSYAAFDANGKRVGYFYNKYDLPNGYYHVGELIITSIAETVAEASKPDFLDIDKDSDKKEPMKKAAADKKQKNVTEGESGAVEAHGVRGTKSTPWRKTFKSQEAFEAWLEKNEGDVEVQGTRKLDESVSEAAVDYDKHSFLGKMKRREEADNKGWGQAGKVTSSASDPEAAHKAMRKSNRYYNLVRGDNKTAAGFPKASTRHVDKVDAEKSVTESKLAECGGMSYDQDSGMSINTSIDTRTGSKTVSVTASGNSADDLMQILKLAGMNGSADNKEPTSSSVKVMSMPIGYGVVGHSGEDHEIEETYANEPEEQIQPVDTQLQQGTDLNRPKPMYKHSYRQGDNPMAMQEARELARLEKEIKEGIESIKVRESSNSKNRSAASAGSADSYYGRSRKPNKSENGVKIYNLTPEEIKAYNKAYDENEESQSFKDWGRD